MSDKIKLEHSIPEELAGLRLDQALAQLFPEFSRGQLSKWIKTGDVQVNNSPRRPRDPVQGGESILIQTELKPQDEEWTAQAIALDITYEDANVLIINKPAGMVVHPGSGNHQGTLANALLAHAPQLVHIPRAGIIHRIDKGTTGLLMIAKTLIAHNSLIAQLQARTVKREYQAIVSGVLTAGGTIDTPISRHHIDRKRMAVSGTGKDAVTHYRVEKRFRAHTHINCKLETGRTHQIRVHMAHIRHPLVGDRIYAGRFRQAKGISDPLRNALQRFDRQALHAGTLGFIHPTTGEEVCWQVDLPEDMQNMLQLLESDRQSLQTQ